RSANLKIGSDFRIGIFEIDPKIRGIIPGPIEHGQRAAGFGRRSRRGSSGSLGWRGSLGRRGGRGRLSGRKSLSRPGRRGRGCHAGGSIRRRRSTTSHQCEHNGGAHSKERETGAWAFHGSLLFETVRSFEMSARSSSFLALGQMYYAVLAWNTRGFT